MKDKNKKRIMLYVVFAILFFIPIIIYNSKNYKIEKTSFETKKVYLLKDYNRFFTIDSCIYKYINYLQTKSVDNILKVLNQDYINKNSINSDNVFNYVETLESMYSFKTKKVYYEELNDNTIKYYAYGYLKEELMDSPTKKNDRYYTLILDNNKQVFNIMPLNKLEFEEAIK